MPPYPFSQITSPNLSLGKRAAQWIQELMMDLEDIETVRERLQFRGAQGTTGSQATFLELFEGDAGKIVKLNDVSAKSDRPLIRPAC
jgi:adenylosuccinate lyase